MAAKNRTLEASIVDELLDFLEAQQKKTKRSPIGIQNGSEIEKKLWLLVAKHVGPLQERVTALEGVLAKAYTSALNTIAAGYVDKTKHPDWFPLAQTIVTDPAMHGRSDGGSGTWCGMATYPVTLPVRKVTTDPKVVTCVTCLNTYARQQQHEADRANKQANEAALRARSLQETK